MLLPSGRIHTKEEGVTRTVSATGTVMPAEQGSTSPYGSDMRSSTARTLTHRGWGISSKRPSTNEKKHEMQLNGNPIVIFQVPGFDSPLLPVHKFYSKALE
jgi:hypothetical protein